MLSPEIIHAHFEAFARKRFVLTAAQNRFQEELVYTTLRAAKDAAGWEDVCRLYRQTVQSLARDKAREVASQEAKAAMDAGLIMLAMWYAQISDEVIEAIARLSGDIVRNYEASPKNGQLQHALSLDLFLLEICELLRACARDESGASQAGVLRGLLAVSQLGELHEGLAYTKSLRPDLFGYDTCCGQSLNGLDPRLAWRSCMSGLLASVHWITETRTRDGSCDEELIGYIASTPAFASLGWRCPALTCNNRMWGKERDPLDKREQEIIQRTLLDASGSGLSGLRREISSFVERSEEKDVTLPPLSGSLLETIRVFAHVLGIASGLSRDS
jgi:hypothetical protein